MRFFRRNHFKVITIAALLVIAYNEFLTYFLQPYKWPNIECTDNKDGCIKILLVADPQILGERAENPLLTYIFNKDSDGFLIHTYAHVVPFFKPHVILFLGDLMDEGSIASKEEFYRYVKRLHDIYNTGYPIKHVWIPGDNDIGGENEPIHPEKVKMFNAAFKQPDYINVKYVDVYKTNSLTQSYLELSHNQVLSNTTKVAISHMPLLITPDNYAANVLAKIQPSVIFSGHRHSATHLITRAKDSMIITKRTDIKPEDQEKIIEVDLREDRLHEFIIPTCSYRMGVKNVGYGAAIIDANQILQFTVLWSPQRFYHLKLYLLFVSVLSLYLFLLISYKALPLNRFRSKPPPYSRV